MPIVIGRCLIRSKKFCRNIQFYRQRSITVEGRLEKSISEHREILAAIERRDAVEADRLTSLHIQAALENLLAVTDLEG